MNRTHTIPMLMFKCNRIGIMGTGTKVVNQTAKDIIEKYVKERLKNKKYQIAALAQLVVRRAVNAVVVGSSPTGCVFCRWQSGQTHPAVDRTPRRFESCSTDFAPVAQLVSALV